MRLGKIINTTGLTKKYNKENVVNEVNLSIDQGDIYGFLGPNGAGKTTTIRMLLGLIKPTEGQIDIFEKDLSANKISILRGVGSLVEHPSYYGNLTGLENLEAISRLLKLGDKNDITNILQTIGLTESKDKLVKKYSLGMKQRLGIGIALLGSPKLLILDEPTNGLDPSGIQEMRELITKLPEERGITVMVSSHLLSEVDQMANKVGIIHEGHLIYQNRIEELRRQSAPKIHLRVNDLGIAEIILKNEGWSTDINSEGIITLDESDDNKIAYIADKLIRQQIAVYRIQEKKRSLEEIFLDLTKKEEDIS
ncbi:ABC transporter ATP-binding protein [Salibacterium salarium]|uniref:ABC transporter ATP-binding protein n=1 Tax=Salibacterium salarium TaxID=284579 RepID=A0A428N8R9_9BACI|nr:ABC transporter ATP-binding protein [Salibacterium salarium]